MKKVLFLVTSHFRIDAIGRQTGFYFDELATPLMRIVQDGFDADIASIRGGEPPIEYRTLRPPSMRSEGQAWLLASEVYFSKLRESLSISEVSGAEYEAIIIPGGHGVMWDYLQTPQVGVLVEEFFEQKKPIASICHGPAALLGASDSRTGVPIVSGKKVTCFTNDEEKMVNMETVVPFLVETELKKLGGDFVSGPLRKSHVVRDGIIITGQNPESSEELARETLNALSDVLATT